jgi:hypothetical protein
MPAAVRGLFLAVRLTVKLEPQAAVRALFLAVRLTLKPEPQVQYLVTFNLSDLGIRREVSDGFICQCCQLLANNFGQINQKIRPLAKKFGRTSIFS